MADEVKAARGKSRKAVLLQEKGELLECPRCGYTVAKATSETNCPHCRSGAFGNRYDVKVR